MTRFPRIALPLVLTALALAAIVSLPQSPSSAANLEIVPGQYIVTLKPGVEPKAKANQKARTYGIGLRHIYSRTLNGFSASMSPAQLKRLQKDPDVVSIAADYSVRAFADIKPSGIRRTLADRNATSRVGSQTNPIAVDVAVIDTGIDIDHPDLNVVGGVNCVPGESSYDDLHGHGTHVAGTIGAIDNGSGVVGVAPGVNLWAVRVLNADGEGEFSDVICGIDWVTQHAGTIEVANMSLGGEGPVGNCQDGSLHQAICASVAAGVTYVVAAGNSSADASGFVPASFPEVITVSAIVDTDGAPGGKGTTSFFYGDDDTLAGFSNYGAPVDIAAPGFNIYSTWPGGGYNYLSGTSMASPHVAGAAAIFKYLNPGASAAAVKDGLLTVAWSQGSTDGFTGDVDSFHEPLLDVGYIGGDPLPPPPVNCTLSAPDGIVGASITVSCANFNPSETVRIYWDSTATTQRVSFIAAADGGGSAKLTIPDAIGGAHQVIVKGMTSGLQTSKPFTVTPSLKLSKTTGAAGASTSATIKGFGAAEVVNVQFDSGAQLKSVTTSATGAASTLVTIPEATGGNHTVSAAGATSSLTANTSYEVVASLALSPTSGNVGATTTVKLRGYAAGETIAVNWYDTPTVATEAGQVTADTNGSATFALTIPGTAGGQHAVEGAGNAGGQATANYNVRADLALSLTSGTVGTPFTALLTGYAEGDTVTINWYDTISSATTVATLTVPASGSASAPLTVPSATYGSHRVEAVSSSGSTSYLYFSVRAGLVLAPSSGEAETSTQVTLTGFHANESLTVKWYDTATTSTVAGTATASATGDATLTIAIPAGATGGDHKVEAIGGGSNLKASANFTVETSGPPPSTDPACTLDLVTGPPTTSAKVTCINFAPSETIRIYWDDTGTTQRTSIWSGASGGGTGTLLVPDATAGAHQVIAVGGNSNLTAATTFTVTPSLKLTSSSGRPGTNVSATLKGFGASETVALTWTGGATLKTATSNAAGSATATFAIPDSPRGDYQVTATGATSGQTVSTAYTVIPGIKLSLSTGYAGASVTATLLGYANGENVALTWHDGASTIDLGTVTASANGTVAVSLTIPEGVYGDHQIDGTGDAGSFASATFSVRERLSLSATSGTVGSAVDYTLTGYGANEQVEIQWFETTLGQTILTVDTNAAGSASGTLTVPESVYGSHKIQANGANSGGNANVSFIVKAALAISPATGAPDFAFTVTLTGYRAGETVTVSWFATTTSSSPIATVSASSLGSASAAVAVPAGASTGDHKVEGKGSSSNAKANATFTVTAAGAGGSGSTMSVEPARDVPFSDTFDADAPGQSPTGWSIAPASSPDIAIAVNANGQLNFGPSAAGGTTSWLIVDGVVYSQPDLSAKLRLGAGAWAGLVLAWQGPADYIAVAANQERGRIEIIEVSGGVVRTFVTNDSHGVKIKRSRDYWLRAETGSDGAGYQWVSVYWSADGQTFAPVAVAGGLLNLDGAVGLTSGAANPASARFDDVVAGPSWATSPATVVPDAVEPSPTSTPAQPSPTTEASPVPTETATPEPTVEATPSPEPTPSETPVVETPVSTPEPTATDTPEPTPTEEPAPSEEPASPPTEPPATETPVAPASDDQATPPSA